MKKVITYGTYDLLHHGHIRLLERAKALGDYLIVGVTSDDYDKARGKINVQQSLAERIAAIKETGLADMIIVEEYEGQKIDDIKRYGADIFTIGSDWEGKFDYLSEYCEVKYLPRTQGVSSSDIRAERGYLRMGLIGDDANYLNKFQGEDKYVNGVEIVGICTNNIDNMNEEIKNLPIVTSELDELLKNVDAVYVKSDFNKRYEIIKKILMTGKSVLCGSPIALSASQSSELYKISKDNNCILMEGPRTAFSTAYQRLLLLIKAGKIGRVLSVDAVCTSMTRKKNETKFSMYEWGSNALLPIFQILGVDYENKSIISHFDNGDTFTKVNFIYKDAVASMLVAEGAKSEGQLVVTGTDGYIYVPAPWWKTDYFEIRYENQTNNKRYFYQLDGEGIRYALVAFCRAVQNKKNNGYVSEDVSYAICKLMEDFNNKIDVFEI